ncbi:NLR family CARD domain-containing protein 3 CARD15-like protein [Takifugu flavidus]|uniref:NLR family CARD domain-containing protein 3 CARD15-like protein n=1 Tax=Takifugu flavidus TaxID=433684 RepID=A0A5C6NV12_9TELE|nr:NLR family CARD domain-containing protein 3 CARD15-like protein [Takifugu flavidus]
MSECVKEEEERAKSTVPSCVSKKSDMSKGEPFNFGIRPQGSPSKMDEDRAESTVPSCVSLKSDHSKDGRIINFRSSDKIERGEHILSNWDQSAPPGESSCSQSGSRSGDAEMKPKQRSDLQEVIEGHKMSLKRRCEHVTEGTNEAGSGTLLNKIYTELYITEGQSEEVDTQHEVRQLERTSKKNIQDTPIKCQDIFKVLSEQQRHIRVVLTNGVAGVGKTFSVQKFSLDWAEGLENQDISLVLPLSFRELNLIRDEQHSLLSLLHVFHPTLQKIRAEDLTVWKLLFIFDGLDESRFSLDFNNHQVISDVTQVSSVDVLLVNLIQGNLLPSALIWITSRPAAAYQIPPSCVDRITEVRGFTDSQKEEYFRRRFSDEDLSKRIISHIKASRSLHIMCLIPVFCWITAIVLEDMMTRDQRGELPKTLTDLYSHFLRVQIKRKKQKYGGKQRPEELTEADKKLLLKLGRLAFEHLEKGNIMFYSEDLERCGLDVSEVSVYSGVCTEIFKREIYCFVHLSIQEFLAAVYMFHLYTIKNKGITESFLKYSKPDPFSWFVGLYTNYDPVTSLDDFLRRALMKSLESKNGHLDLFVRFLHGLSLESNQRILGGLLDQMESHPGTIQKVLNNLKEVNSDKISPDRSINIFHCLMEMKDQSVHQEIQEFLKSEKKSERRLSEIHCSALAYLLQMSEEVLDELDLEQYNTSEEGRRRLIPAVRNCRKVVLSGSFLSKSHWEVVASAMTSNPSHLRELSLSEDKSLTDAVVKLLSSAMMHPNCRLETLRLSRCSLSDLICDSLAWVLRSNPSHLRVLDLSYISLEDPAVKLFCGFLQDPLCKLETLSQKPKPASLLKGQQVEQKPPAEKVLSERKWWRTMKLAKLHLSSRDGLSWSCGTRLRGCSLSETSCDSVASALKSNPSHLRVLDLSFNKLQDSGVKQLCSGLESPNCKLETLRMDEDRAESTVPSCVSLKSDRSKDRAIDFRSSDKIERGEHILSNWDQSAPPGESSCSQSGSRSGDAEMKPKQRSDLQEVIEGHKMSLKGRCEHVTEGTNEAGSGTLLNKIYTELYITEGQSEEVDTQHEVRQLERTSKKNIQDTPIKCQDIFKVLSEQQRHIRVVLTNGVAGVGKTFSVQKFSLDWAEGLENQDISLVLPLSFRELNLIRDEQHSLLSLLHVFHPPLQKIRAEDLTVWKLLFIFDGLDESRFSLDFNNHQVISDVTQVSPVDVLLVNLIQGNLLPSALIWITSRPAAAYQIPPSCVDRITEVRGFTDSQKEEYFRRRFSDEDLSKRIISHIKASRSLHIMCLIPVFCWITAIVLEDMMTRDQRGELPKTPTDLYSHFLMVQIKRKKQKYGGKQRPEELTEADKKLLLKLGRLAFEHLEKGNIMFYSEDLKRCGLDVSEVSVYSGVCTEICKRESVIFQKSVYCFVHLSIQEFLAAVYMFHCYTFKNKRIMESFLKYSKPNRFSWFAGLFTNNDPATSLDDFLRRALMKSLESKNGHLDLFVRFLHGLSLESNQRILGGLLDQMESHPETIQKVLNNLKEVNSDEISPDRSINIFHCLMEMKDQSVHQEIQEFLKSERRLSEIHCSALAYLLQMSEEVLDELDLQQYNTSDEGRRRLIPAVRNCRKVV